MCQTLSSSGDLCKKISLPTLGRMTPIEMKQEFVNSGKPGEFTTVNKLNDDELYENNLNLPVS